MSTPRNILDSYRSYSYHHILVACDSVSVAEALADQGEITLFDADGLEDRYQPQQVPGIPGAGQYVIIFNGASDALFYISEMKWTTYPMPSDNFRAAMATGEMNITEPKGVRFLNVLSNVSERLNVDSKGMVFLLKTIFTGYRSDGGYDLISTVDPFLFTMYDIAAEFSVTGATYAISFAAVVNGTGRLSEVSAITDGFSFQLDQTDDDTNTTVEDAMEALQIKLNKRYQAFKKKLKEESECAGVEIDWDGEFIDVEYRIQIDEDYKNFSVGTNEKFLKKNFGGTDAIIVQDNQTMSVERLIESVMMSSQDLMIADNPVRAADTIDVEQGASQAEWEAFREADRRGIRPGPQVSPSEAGQQARTDAEIELEARQDTVRAVNKYLPKYTFKINSTVNSTPDRFIVTYHINRHRLPFNYRNVDGETDMYIPNPDEGIVFDYIFTGQNIDILDFNMKMNMGQAFYQSLLTSDSIPSASSYVNYQVPQTFGSGSGEINSMQTGKNTTQQNQEEQSKKPLFLGMSLRQMQRRNKQNSGAALSYDGLLQRFAMYESTATTVTIRGNPQLLAESAPLPSRLINNDSVPVVADEGSLNDGSDGPTSIIPRIWNQFGYVKINIHMPALSDNDPDFSEQFWYPGWYYISQIENSFQDGEFTQTLSIHAIPTDQSNQSAAGIESCDEEITIGEFTESNQVKASNIIKGRGASAQRIEREREQSKQARSNMSGSGGSESGSSEE